MISQVAPNKYLRAFPYDKDKGFYVEGKDLDDCLRQVREWSMSHSDRLWIYYFPVGMKPSYPVPIARYLLEVIFSYEPIGLCGVAPFWILFRKGAK